MNACTQAQYPIFEENTSKHRDAALKPFYHGVASGDPLQDGVIIWTRISPEVKLPVIEANWEIATDKEFGRIVQSGSYKTSLEKDYTVKIDVKDLKSGTKYYYRFHALEATSMVGETMTAASDAEELKFAVVSCSNYEFGYFNAYGAVAREENLSAVLHLGDYIYEYEPGRYGDTTIGRINIPSHEIVSLQDYRDRYSLYRLDPDLRAAHALHPFIAIWDDHEITNNSYKDGAENHQAEEGDYEIRKATARQVYYEWMPIRENEEHYRKFSFGELADLVMLDERLAGRSQQVDSISDPALNNEKRSMLGETQFNWFASNLKSSKAQWKLIGNQVIYSYLDWGYEQFSLNMDAWDGYPYEQQKVADLIQSNNIENIIILTGDTHTAWAIEATNDPLESYDPSTSEGAFAVEFGVTSINSANANERFEDDFVLEHEKKIVNSAINPHLKYTNMRDHGYLLLLLDQSNARADYKIVTTKRERSEEINIDKVFMVESGSTRLRQGD